MFCDSLNVLFLLFYHNSQLSSIIKCTVNMMADVPLNSNYCSNYNYSLRNLLEQAQQGDLDQVPKPGW